MTTHLYAPPGDFPDTLCGISGAWTDIPRVYPKDLDQVTCPECRAHYQPPEPFTAEIQRHQRLQRLEFRLQVLFWISLLIFGLIWALP